MATSTLKKTGRAKRPASRRAKPALVTYSEDVVDTSLPEPPAEDLPAQQLLPIAASSDRIQQTPIRFTRGDDELGVLMIESARLKNRVLEISGWQGGSVQLQLLRNGVEIDCSLTRTHRPDLENMLAFDEPEDGFGLVLTAEYQRQRGYKYVLRATVRDGEQDAVFEYPLAIRKPAPPEGVPAEALHAVGYLEAGAASVLTGNGAIVGWVVHGPEIHAWLENEDGDRYPLTESLRFPRQDVLDAYSNSYGHIGREAGFIARLTGLVPGEKIKLMASDGLEKMELSSTVCSSLAVAPVAAARWLFGLNAPANRQQQKFDLIEAPLIEELQQAQQRAWSDLRVETFQLGKAMLKPKVSVIVPLYGRSDFVEHQLLEFCRDPWFVANAQLIYVIDDPNLAEHFPAQAQALFRLYRLPFKWVWGGVNRGFSGANNLGATQARGNHLLFLNSDVFPQGPGWLKPLLDVLDADTGIGAVAPRLVFADGSIQHAGMEFIRREELGFWINHHPHMGLDPALDPSTELRLMPAITGACLAMRRCDFDLVDGWDNGYLIGDFEDSDLCLKLRSCGLRVAYLPTVQLTHLERQSFKLLGGVDFRSKVVAYNALRHQGRWGKVMQGVTR